MKRNGHSRFGHETPLDFGGKPDASPDDADALEPPKRRRNKESGAMLARSRVTNGSALLPEIDGRSLWARRYKDLINLHLTDLGGEAAASEGEKAIVRR